MERLVIVLNSLLVLMASTQVACASSHKSSFDDLLCKSKPVTVVEVQSEEHLDKDGNTVNTIALAASTNYSMILVELTYNGSGISRKEVEDYEVQVQWQRVNCTYRFSKKKTCYLSGGANKESTIEAIECKHRNSFSWVQLKHGELDGYHDLINGYRELKC